MVDFPTTQRNLKNLRQKSERSEISYKPSDEFIFEPKPDITTKELADVLAKVILKFHFSLYQTLPSSLQRHFRYIKAGS